MNKRTYLAIAAIIMVSGLSWSCEDDSAPKGASAGDCPVTTMVTCNGTCIDPNTDNAFCGADASCEHYTACIDGQTCQNGVCVGNTPVTCNPGMVKCGDNCVNPNTDNNYCGADFNCQNYTACGDGQTCQNGRCSGNGPADTCDPGLVKCGEDCIDPKTDNSYCGADADCLNYTACVDGQTCQNGLCSGDEPVDACDPGLVKCGEDCIDPNTSNDFCGADADCLNYTACVDGQTCQGGLCSEDEPVEACDPGLVKCGEDCIDPNANNDFCGSDANCQNYAVCFEGQSCQGGGCVCDPGLVQCGTECIDPLSSNSYCGADASCSEYTECTDILECQKGKCIDPTPLSLTIQSESTEIQEDGSLELTLSLNHAPENDIDFVITLDEASAVILPENLSIEPETITLTTTNWQSYSFFIQTKRDFKKTGDKTLNVQAKAKTDDSLSTQTDILYKDIDKCGLVFNPSENYTTSENGTTISIEVSLSCIPDSDVIYSFLSDNAAEGIIQEPADKLMHFTPETWDIPQTLTVMGIDDEVPDGAQSYRIIFTPDPTNTEDFQRGYPLPFINHDNDVPAINANDITITENGAGILEISLATKPSANVNVVIDSLPDELEFVNINTLTFTPENYHTSQSIAIHAIDNHIIEESRVLSVHLSATSEDSDYQNLNRDIQVTVEDDDFAGLVFKESGYTFNKETTLKEKTMTTSDFSLASKPKKDVTVHVAVSDDITAASIHKSDFKFTPDNWDTPQTLEIYFGRNGIVDSAPLKGSITFEGISEDFDYNCLLKEGIINVTNIDKNKMIFSGEEDPEEGTYTTTISENSPYSYKIKVKLGSKPAYPVTIQATSSKPNKLKLPVSSTTIKASDWDEWHTISFAAVDNTILDGDQKAFILFTLSSLDGNYDGLGYKSNDITIIDDESPSLIVNASTTKALECDESDSTIQYSVKLANQPTSNVTVSASLEEYKSFSDLEYTKHAGISVTPSTLKFTPSNYNTEQTITVSCTINEKALYNYLRTNIRFKSSTSSYPASDVLKTFYSYPIGSYMWIIEGNTEFELPRGEYQIRIYGAQGGGNDNHGGYGGSVILDILFDTTVKKQVELGIYPGQQGKRGPTSSSETNNSGGWGAANTSGGNGDWGTSNWSYGGGGATVVYLNGSPKFYAGGGGGGTAKWKDPSGWGGDGGCETMNDSQCYGRDEDSKYYSNGNLNGSNGESSTKGDEEGGGGGGWRGGRAGSKSQVGGNGGTSYVTNSTPGLFTIKSKTIKPGGHRGNGEVDIIVIKSTY